MSLTNKLKKQIDLPVWEYCRFAPATTTAVSSLTTGNTLNNRYLYYQVSGVLYRYDTISDSWGTLSTMPASYMYTPTIMNNNVMTNSIGHYGQAISGTSNTISLAAIVGKALIGYKIRIIKGTGAGQEKTITNVSDSIVHDTGEITTGSGLAITDANTGLGFKNWSPNKWRNYQLKLQFGTGKTQVRSILWNNSNSITISSAEYITHNPWAYVPFYISPTAGTLYYIESNIVTVDSDWAVIPDSTSQFVILSGGIWNISQGLTTSPFFSFNYYDVIIDAWYCKQVQTNLKTAVFTAGSDLSMERFTENGGVIKTGTVTSSGNKYVQVDQTMSFMEYANFEIRITSGNGIGQVRTISSNTNSRISIYRNWDINPDASSTFEIWRDVGKILLTGGGDSIIFQHNSDTNQFTTAVQLDFGVCSNISANRKDGDVFSISGISRISGGIISINSAPTAGGTGYNVNDLLTITQGGASALARVTSINATTGAVLSVKLESNGTGATIGTGKATTVSPTGGTGCTLEITSVDYIEEATTIIDHNFNIGDSVTIAGCSGTGASKFNGTYNVIGIYNSKKFYYCSVGDPGAASATIANSNSTTQLVDPTKNWITNEHVGKIVQISSNNAITPSGQARRITANSATTLTFATISSGGPSNGVTKYVITKPDPIGTEMSSASRAGGGNFGFATSGTTTSLTDSTKSWIPNWYSRGVNRYLRIFEGTGAGTEIPITSNSANTLYFATQTFTPDTTTRYVIMEMFGSATSGSTTTLVDNTKNWEVNTLINKRVKFLTGTGQGNEYTITANTSNTLTFATGTAPDATTMYAILESPPRTFGIHIDAITGSSNTSLNNRYLYIWSGSATTELMRLNINTEHFEWLQYTPQTETLSTGSMYVYDGDDRIYFWSGTYGRMMYYDLVLNKIENSSTPPYGMSTAISGNRMEIIKTEDGLKYLYLMRHTGNEMWRTLLFW